MLKKVEEKIRRKEDLRAYEKHFRLEYDSNGYLQSYKRNENKIQKEINRLGFFVIVTSKEISDCTEDREGQVMPMTDKKKDIGHIF